MRTKNRIRVLVVLVVAIVTPLLSHTVVYGQDVTAFGCEATQRYLRNVQKARDVRTRVDRLQAYRYIHQRLDVFIGRIERNNQPNAKNMRADIDRLYDATEAFRLDYEVYDTARDTVSTLEDCRNNTEQFANKLQEAREKRAIVAQDVALIRSIIGTNIPEQLDVIEQKLKEQENR